MLRKAHNLGLATTMRSCAGATCAARALQAGSIVGGKYAVMKLLGEGAMGQVWVAENTATRAMVVLKTIHPDRASSGDALALLQQEARTTAGLQHRGIVRVFDLVELASEGGGLMIVMEWLRGETLAARLAARGRMSVGETMAIVLPLLAALAHAHAMGIVHRDLKPENVFLAREPDGTIVPKILDFGVAKSIRSKARLVDREGTLSGTPCYMSPEQARGDTNVDARSDIFAVGVMIYELLSGHNPFQRDELPAVLLAVLGDGPRRIAGIPPALWRVLGRALAKRREDRYGSDDELANALSNAARVTARDWASFGGAARRPVRVAFALAAAITVTLGGLLSTTPATHAARAAAIHAGAPEVRGAR